MSPEEKKESFQRPLHQQGQDIVYILNHGIACGLNDVIVAPAIGNFTQNFLGARVHLGCGPDRLESSPHEQGAHPSSKLGHWLVGEAVGDFGAVPVTLALQHYAPGMMDGLHKLMEPVLGPLFRSGARRSVRQWARENGVAGASAEAKKKEEEIYSYELEHLPQAAVWTASSVALNIGMQKLIGNKGPVWQIAAGKLAGSGVSAAMVVTGRSAFPGVAHRWDDFAARQVVDPATKAVAGVFGVNDSSVESLEREHKALKEDNRWGKRMQSRKAPEQPSQKTYSLN